MNPTLQTRIEDLIHSLQFETLKDKFIIWKGKKDKDLLKGLWLIATYQYPDLELGTLKIRSNSAAPFTRSGQRSTHLEAFADEPPRQ